MSDLTDIDYVRSKLSDPWWRLNNLYKIENEKGQLVTFRMRKAQRELFQSMHYRNIILKARQMGFSTAIDLYLLDCGLFGNNLKCGIIAQDQSAAGEIFRTKVEIPFDNLPEWLRSEFQVTARRSGSTGGYMLFANGSSIQVATSFRSGTVQRLHCSELGKVGAKYPAKEKEVKTGTLNAIHDGCIVFIESTAEGVGNLFHTMSMAAMELQEMGVKPNLQQYKFFFFPWYDDPKYHAHVPETGLILSKQHQEYFAAVEKAMNVTLLDSQKQWYVNKEAEQGEEIKQEFPSTPIEAFLTSGRKVFDAIKLMHEQAKCTRPAIVYDLEPVTGRKTKVNNIRNIDSSKDLEQVTLNHLLVWELPDEEEEYAIGVDIAEGLEHRDRSSLDVIKKSNGEQVAHWFGYLDTELFAQLTAHIGKMYGLAYIGPERNNHGHAYIQKLKDIYPVRRIYQEQYLDRDNDDDTQKLGWLTTRQSKPIIIENLKTLIRNGRSGINWIGTISECHAFVYDKKGSMGAQEGGYDDQVMSFAIAQEMVVRMPERMNVEEFKRLKHHWMTY